MAGFDPAMKRVYECYQVLGPGPDGKPLYQRMEFNFVSYDNEPERWIEPAEVSDFVEVFSGEFDPITPTSDGTGRIAGFEFFTGRPFEVHSFNDFEADNNAGQLPAAGPDA